MENVTMSLYLRHYQQSHLRKEVFFCGMRMHIPTYVYYVYIALLYNWPICDETDPCGAHRQTARY